MLHLEGPEHREMVSANPGRDKRKHDFGAISYRSDDFRSSRKRAEARCEKRKPVFRSTCSFA
ncbi:hypothetical protein B1812_00240 [Methylocystis bryophila]|uniref:Uncharacterized protein n=1 Tax=Methylocystis bryophila TaxID=655015 RepID=A0A1W6MQ81_9HYPH|nr:hypothetical protein B1812_00240 [Methylocystis bryophila]